METKNLITEQLKEKWEPILEAEGVDPIQNSYKRNVTTHLLENQQQALQETAANFSGDLGSGTNIASFDPVMISLVRRAMPNLIAYDVGGVQPMNGPTSLIFALRSRYKDDSDGSLTDDPEALFNEARTAYSGAGSDGTVGTSATGDEATDPSVLLDDPAGDYETGTGMTTAQAEALGNTGDSFNEMGITIDKVTVTAKSRALKAEYTMELAQDLKQVHGLDAETELANILSTEILAEINREFIRNIFITSKVGGQQGLTNAGIFDLNTDSSGRWSKEKFQGLMFQIDREANQIAKETRRGKGNFIICSSDVASALEMAGKLDYTPALDTNLNVNEASTTFAGVLNGRYKVYIDPYFSASTAGNNFLVVGYRGQTPYDAGLFYTPYVPLQMVKAQGENDFQPRIGFKTRYGMAANPFAEGTTVGNGAITANSNVYFRKMKITNLL